MLTIHLLFLASGAAALIYQIVWFKQLQLVLGSSTYSVSVTIAAMGATGRYGANCPLVNTPSQVLEHQGDAAAQATR